MTLFEHILVESRVDDFKKLLRRKFNSDYLEKIINRDTSKNHKNLLWIGKMLMTEPDLNDEDLFKNLEIFNKVGRSADLYSFRDYSSFLQFLQQRSKEVQMGKMAQIKAGSRTIKDDKRWLVVVPETHEASKYFGGGTSWCISTSNDSYWNEYYHENTIIMIKDRTKKPDDPLFKVAIVGNAYESLWGVQNDDREDKIRELSRHTKLWDTNDRKLSDTAEENYLSNLPEDLIDDIINYMNDDDIYERQHERYYNLAYARFQDDGRDILLKELFDATVDYLNVDTDIDRDEFDEIMGKLFAVEIENGDWNEFLLQLWRSCISYQGVDDDNFYPSISKRDIKNLINDTEYSYEIYFDLATGVLKDDDVSNMDDIIKASLKRSEDERYDPYLVLKRHSNQLENTNYTDILYNSVKMYNAKYNPNFFQGQMSLKLGNEFGAIVNKFTPRNIDDVIKILSINPRAIDMVNWIQKYRKDLRESKKIKMKYRDFYKL